MQVVNSRNIRSDHKGTNPTENMKRRALPAQKLETWLDLCKLNLTAKTIGKENWAESWNVCNVWISGQRWHCNIAAQYSDVPNRFESFLNLKQKDCLAWDLHFVKEDDYLENM